jgi:hypothetical protein
MTARQKGLEAAARRTVAALRKAGSLEAVDELRVANVMFTAARLDAMDPLASPAVVASMVRAHLAATKLLFGQDVVGGDDGMAEVLALLRDIPLGDAPVEGGYRLAGQAPPRVADGSS